MNKPLQNSTYSLLHELSQVVEENLSNEQFGVNELSDAVGMSRSTLHRKLQDLSGQSISQFIREYRLKRARDLLTTENISASDAAFRVGFNSASYFSKSFNDFYGYPPGEAKIRDKPPGIDTPPRSEKRTLTIAIVVLLVALAALLVFWNNREMDTLPTEKSIVVLPFNNLSSEAENQYFADGVMDAIRTKLAGINELRVASRTSAERYRNNTSKSVSQIADELNVAYILEGSAQKYGSGIQVNTQLVDARNDENLWSQNFTGSFEDILTLQGDIAEQVAAELQAVLSVEEKEQLSTPPTINSEAYDYYLLAKYQFLKWTHEGFQKAIPLYEAAIDKDPAFVEAYVGLGYLYETSGLVWGFLPEDVAFEKTKFYLNKALELDPDQGGALTYLASAYFYYDYDFEKARELYLRAYDILGYYIIETTDLLLKMDEPEEALKASTILMEEDPLTSSYYYIQAEALFFMGDTAKAVSRLDEALHFFDNIYILREASKNYYLFGEYDKSRQALEKHLDLYPDRQPIINYLLAAHATLNENNPQPFIDALFEQYEQKISGSPAWHLAMYYADFGTADEVFDWLYKSYDDREVELTWLKMEPTLAPFRKDPRYVQLYEKMGFVN